MPSAGEIEVRPAAAADIETWLDLYAAVAGEGRWIGGELPIDRARMEKGFLAMVDDPEEGVFVAEADGRIVGQLGIGRKRDGHAELGMLVADGWRGRGVGSALMDAAIDWARAHDVHKVALEVWPHNEAAIALYRKFGFEEEGYLKAHYRRRNGELWDVVVMGLPIS